MSFFNLVQQQHLATSLFISNQKTLVQVTPHLLSVILDRSLMFNAHMKKQLRPYCPVSISSELQHILPGAGIVPLWSLICSKLHYAAPAWYPWLSATSLSYLHCLQIRPLQLITGQVVCTSLEAFCLEADLQNPFSNWLILKAQE